MKLTKKDIIEYRAAAKKTWHDETWHTFMATRKAEAIGYAEEYKEYGDTYKDIISRAEEYLLAVN